MGINNNIETLLAYAKKYLGLGGLDALLARNSLFKLFGLTSQGESVLCDKYISGIEIPYTILAPLGEYAVAKGLTEDYNLINFYGGVMGLVTPAPSVIADKFSALKQKDPAAATDYLYDLSIKNYYIQMTAVKKNLYWKSQAGDNYIEVTVNLGKPEKSNAEIAKLLTMPSADYPKCNLCIENMGYPGGAKQGARQHLRLVPVTLDGENWYLQYSPYIYYDEHCIVISERHTPMKVDASTVRKLLDFVKEFPHYFVGSNASLPRIGGSILNHEHFQGGRHLMPLQYAADAQEYHNKKFPAVKMTRVNWFNSVIRLTSKDYKQIAGYAAVIIDKWQSYSDESIDIYSQTADGSHNSLSPIARVADDGAFVLDLILRNNRCTPEYPEGQFHAHPEYHNIKREGIGLIEAMGMFILPGRLVAQTKVLEEYLTGAKVFDEAEFLRSPEAVHNGMLKKLLNTFGTKNTPRKAQSIIREEINSVCVNILKNTAVFKDDEKGKKAFERFMKEIL